MKFAMSGITVVKKNVVKKQNYLDHEMLSDQSGRFQNTYSNKMKIAFRLSWILNGGQEMWHSNRAKLGSRRSRIG